MNPEPKIRKNGFSQADTNVRFYASKNPKLNKCRFELVEKRRMLVLLDGFEEKVIRQDSRDLIEKMREILTK